jgi:hypothetical protein
MNVPRRHSGSRRHKGDVRDGQRKMGRLGSGKRVVEPIMQQRKYHSGNLIPMFRLAAKLCKEMRAADFTDNGGAIHSAERILNILGLCLVYPDLSHINNLRKYERAEFSVKARAAYDRGEKVLIEHVSPVRDFTRRAIDKIDELDDGGFAKFVKRHFRLVLLTPEETVQLNRQNRSKMSSNRLAGIKMAKSKAAGRNPH